MNSSKNKVSLLFIIILHLSACNTSEIPNAEILPTPTQVLPKKNLSQIDLSKLDRIAPKGRVQDKEDNQLPIIDDLIANGKDSIPFLIGKLDDETKINRHVLDYWYEVSIGDLALAILTDFFTDASGKNTTISGLSWDEFLERGNDKDSTGEAILRKYIKKHGRKKIKERWQKIWEQNKENIYWNESDRCFKVKKSENN